MATEPADSASKEAFQFWGYLFKQDNCGVDLFDRLLAGIANYIVCALALPTRARQMSTEAAVDEIPS